MIGGLFVLYGLILIVAGALASGAELRKASGIDINLWMGIGMFILGALFLFWWRARPLRVQPAPESEQPELPPKLQRETVSRGQDTAAHPARRSEVSSVAPRQNGDDSAI
jgi:cytoskeletal protein RodZ